MEKELKKRMFELSTSNFNTMVDFGAYSAGYMGGAKWGYKLAVDKACKWFESNCTHLVLMKGEYYDSKEIVEQFRKAMKGE